MLEIHPQITAAIVTKNIAAIPLVHHFAWVFLALLLP